ncbi:MAG: sigma-70 family RNA polymerase sigma factor [Planctomycetes bacterium]|nr:sigma-70 family RNA polymerase sigma factor [Planctomycetota bacterium]
MEFETFFKQHEKRAWNLARAWTRTNEDADDVLQESLVIAWRKQQTSWPWFANVIKNVARNKRRKKTMDYLESDPPEQALPSRAEQEELAGIMHSALQKLGEEEREAIGLICVGGLSAEEASESTGTNVNTLRSRYQRGLQHLRQHLKKSEDDIKYFLAGLPFGVPRGGWDASSTRWLQNAKRHHSIAKFKTAGAAGIAASVALLALLAPREWMESAPRNERQLASITTSEQVEASPTSGKPDVKTNSKGETKEPAGAPEEPPAKEPPSEPEENLQPKEEQDDRLPKVRTRSTKFENGKVEAQWTERLENGKYILDGPYTAYYSAGTARQIGQYSNGVRSGMWKFNHLNGNTESEGEFRNGKKHGPWVYYFDTQERESCGEFFEGKRDGEWRSWHKNSHPRTIEPYEKGVLVGTRYEFFEDGSPYLETPYENGQKHGVEIEYDREGASTKRTYKHGKLQE